MRQVVLPIDLEATSFTFLEREQDGVCLFRVDVDPNLSECVGHGLAGFLGLHCRHGPHAGGGHTYIIYTTFYATELVNSRGGSAPDVSGGGVGNG